MQLTHSEFSLSAQSTAKSRQGGHEAARTSSSNLLRTKSPLVLPYRIFPLILGAKYNAEQDSDPNAPQRKRNEREEGQTTSYCCVPSERSNRTPRGQFQNEHLEGCHCRHFSIRESGNLANYGWGGVLLSDNFFSTSYSLR